MTAIFGRNNGLASGPLGDVPVSDNRFYALADEDGIPAVYDALTGRYAPGLDAEAAADFEFGIEDTDKYQWSDHL